MRWRSLVRGLDRVLLGLVLTVTGIVAFPDPLFAYSASSGHVTILSDQPLDQRGAQAVMSDVERRLTRSPLAFGAGHYKLVVTNEDWRRRLFFLHMYDVGGVAFYPLTQRHVFLSGADFAHDRLLRPSGEPVDPPRTLGYYGAHEIAHLLTGEKAGPLRFLTIPTWVVEGLADYCALGSPGDLRAFDRQLGPAPITVEQMKTYGVYPRYRMLVSFLLEERHWTVDQLLATDMTESDALRLLRQAP